MPIIATVFFNWNGKSAASLVSFRKQGLEWRELCWMKSYMLLQISRKRPRLGSKHGDVMVRLVKFLLILVLLVALVVVGYAYLGDLTPTTTEVDEPIELDAQD